MVSSSFCEFTHAFLIILENDALSRKFSLSWISLRFLRIFLAFSRWLFWKTLQLRCLTGFWIRPCYTCVWIYCHIWIIPMLCNSVNWSKFFSHEQSIYRPITSIPITQTSWWNCFLFPRSYVSVHQFELK